MSELALITPDSGFDWRVKFAVGASPDSEFRRWREDYTRIDPSKVVADAAPDQLDVACIGPGLDLDQALEIAAAFDRDRPEVCVVLAFEPTTELWQLALQAGARDVVNPEAGPDELRAVIARALETAHRRREKLPNPVEPTGPQRRVISVISPKGGAGKTTVAVNLAVGLARRAPNSVAIVDLDLQFGDVSAALQLQPEHTLADLAHAGSGVDSTGLKVFLTPHPSGLWALCGPPSPVDADEISPTHVTRTLSLLTAEFPFVVIDTSNGLHEETLAALDASSDLVLVCPMDVAGVRNLRKELDTLDRAGVVAPRRHLVLNRADSRVGISPSDVAEVLGMEVDVAVPSSRAVPVSLNEGLPLVESTPRGPVATQLQQLVGRFSHAVPSAGSPSHTPAHSKGGWLTRHRKETR